MAHALSNRAVAAVIRIVAAAIRPALLPRANASPAGMTGRRRVPGRGSQCCEKPARPGRQDPANGSRAPEPATSGRRLRRDGLAGALATRPALARSRVPTDVMRAADQRPARSWVAVSADARPASTASPSRRASAPAATWRCSTKAPAACCAWWCGAACSTARASSAVPATRWISRSLAHPKARELPSDHAPRTPSPSPGAQRAVRRRGQPRRAMALPSAAPAAATCL